MALFLSRAARLMMRKDGPPARPRILLPFLIIAIGLGVLAWRSYQLSVRMELGANTLANQYVGYAADITARRLDSAARAEFFRSYEEWQQVERRVSSPTFSALRQWIDSNPWIVSAIYVPDYDPTRSVYVTELPGTDERPQIQRLTREFYTASGSVRYTYDPSRLLERIKPSVRQQPFVRADDAPSAVQLSHKSEIRVVVDSRARGMVRTPDGVAFIAPLDAPLDHYAIRASVSTLYIGSGLENQRVISLGVSALALVLTALGGFLAMRGLKRESEAMQLRGALIANVSHELRTPLSMIRLGAETLKRSARLTPAQQDEIQESILREVLHLSHLVENVLDVARMQRDPKALAVTPVYPRELLKSLMTTYDTWIRSKGFTVSLSIDEGIEEQQWDRDAVSRALLNLIDNAIKYSANEKWISVALRQSGQWIVLEVSDRGIGIDPEEIGRIFEPYYRARFSPPHPRRRPGLGLTLVRQIALSHDGKVEVESVPGKGSTFRLLLPRAIGAGAAAPATMATPSGATS
jgi:nitrogen-specific signal transduction histidine kinase